MQGELADKSDMKKILIIEDDPIIAHVYKTRLEREGYEVQVAPDGHTGFYRIHELRPDAVLLDLMLPKINGIDILKKIRGESQFAQLPVLVFTNAYVPNMVNESFQAGATQVFNKASLTPRQIIEAVHTSIEIAEATPVGQTRVAPAQPPAFELAPEDTETPGFVPPVSVDKEFQAQLVQSFLQKRQESVSLLRTSMQEFSNATDEASRLEYLLGLYRKVHSITSSAGLAGLHNIAQMAAAVEVLLKELREKPKNINASTFRTVAHSIDFIAGLLNRGDEGQVVDVASIEVMVVDDEILSRRAIAYALEQATMKPTIVEDTQTALTLANERVFDCIFLDVRMPGMDGFELCSKIRTVTLNRATPVIFVTVLTDLKSRARSSLSGGSEFIAKPFMSIELSVKALTYVMRSRAACPSLPVAQAA
jgi:DNA-binding response OmpR family regulator